MKLLRKEKREGPLTGGQEKLASQLAGKILFWQRGAADYLNSKTSGLSIWSWKMMLTGFCLVFGAYCLWLLVQAF
jgi:hypothetical protein